MGEQDPGKTGFFPVTAILDWNWWAALWPDPEGLLGKLGVPWGRFAVDLCCGDGYSTAHMSRPARPAKRPRATRRTWTRG